MFIITEKFRKELGDGLVMKSLEHRKDALRLAQFAGFIHEPGVEAMTRELVLHHPDVEYHGFQYVDWLFDGDDLIVASRTAFDDGLGGAHNQHDANFLTFHRVVDFEAHGADAEE